jgi:hypothetical protein
MPSIISAGTTTGTALSLTSDTSGELQIRTNNGLTTAMTLTTAGNVGVGTTTPNAKLEVRGNELRIYDTGTSNVNLSLRNSTTGDAAGFGLQQDGVNTILYNGSNGYMSFYTNTNERMRIESGGNILIGATSNIFAPKLGVTTSSSFPIGAITSQIAGSIFSKSTDGAGNQILFLSNNNFNYGIVGVNNANGTSAGDQFQLGYTPSAGSAATGVLLWGRAATCVGLNTAPATSGTGITFPTSQNASSDANTLDDYEEGTWTPVDVSGAGLSLTVFGTARYVKIGQLVFFSVDQLNFPSTSNTNAARIGGLPFTNNANNTGGINPVANNANADAGLVIANDSSLFLYAASSLSGSTNASLSGANIYGLSGCYQVP